MKNIFLTFIFIFLFFEISGQTRTVEGKIVTFKTIPVAKAQIIVKSSNQKFFSDSLGMFSVTCASEDILMVTAKGFVQDKVKIKEKTKFALINLKLEPGEEAKEFATGYGHVKDKEKLYAMASQSDGTFMYSRYRNIYEALIGNFNGVQLINGEIIVRGSSTFGSSAPALLIVDGREVSKDFFGNIPTNEISSMTVLKDASASTYGVRGGNGVVIVETKRGSRQ